MQMIFSTLRSRCTRYSNYAFIHQYCSIVGYKSILYSKPLQQRFSAVANLTKHCWFWLPHSEVYTPHDLYQRKYGTRKFGSNTNLVYALRSLTNLRQALYHRQHFKRILRLNWTYKLSENYFYCRHCKLR